MIALLCFFLTLLTSPFKSKSRLEAENAALRHQLTVLQRRVSGRVHLTNGDVTLYRWFPSILRAITIIRPETLVRWHRAGFRRYWRWKSRSFGGRPKIDVEGRADPADERGKSLVDALQCNLPAETTETLLVIDQFEELPVDAGRGRARVAHFRSIQWSAGRNLSMRGSNQYVMRINLRRMERSAFVGLNVR
jgi:hypothetical protein